MNAECEFSHIYFFLQWMWRYFITFVIVISEKKEKKRKAGIFSLLEAEIGDLNKYQKA